MPVSHLFFSVFLVPFVSFGLVYSVWCLASPQTSSMGIFWNKLLHSVAYKFESRTFWWFLKNFSHVPHTKTLSISTEHKFNSTRKTIIILKLIHRSFCIIVFHSLSIFLRYLASYIYFLDCRLLKPTLTLPSSAFRTGMAELYAHLCVTLTQWGLGRIPKSLFVNVTSFFGRLLESNRSYDRNAFYIEHLFSMRNRRDIMTAPELGFSETVLPLALFHALHT